VTKIDILPSQGQLEILDGLTRALEGAAVGAADFPLIASLGFVAVSIPESLGGLGCDIADEALLNIEHGRRVVGLEVLASTLAARLAAATGDRDLVSDIVAGRRAVGFASPVAGWDPSAPGPSGEVHLIGRGDLYLAVAPQGGAILDPAQFSDTRTVEGMDAIAPTFRARLAGSPPSWADGDAKLWPAAVLLFAAQMAGIAAAAMNQAVEYAKIREQFGKPIGSFQAVAHQCADAAVRADAAYHQVLIAAIALRDHSTDAEFQVTAACLTAIDAAFRNSTSNIQVHGGMGYAVQSGAQLFLKRATVLRHLCGGVRLHERAMLAAQPPH